MKIHDGFRVNEKRGGKGGEIVSEYGLFRPRYGKGPKSFRKVAIDAIC